MSQLSKTSGSDIRFGGGVAGEPVPSAKPLKLLAETNARRTEAIKTFARRPTATAIGGLVDTLVDFDKARSGRMWRATDADRLAKIYRQAIGSGDLAQLDASVLGNRAENLRKLSKAQRRKWTDGPMVPLDGPGGGDIDPKATGWYWESHYDYSSGSAFIFTYEDFNDPVIGGGAICVLDDVGDAGHCWITAETGRWFNFTMPRSGSPKVVCFYDTQFETLSRRVFPKTPSAEITDIQAIHGCVGLLSGDEFIGRNYVELRSWNFKGSGFDAAANGDDTPMDAAGFVSHGTSRIEAGERVQVLFGIRAKIISITKHCSANLTTAHRAYPSILGCGVETT